MNFENYTQNTTEINAQPTPVEMNFENYTQNTNNEVNYDQYQATETATTTTTTQFDTQNNAQDERLVKLEGDTNSLKNEHQEIQAKLSNLLNQVNSYKSQVESLEREKNSRELSALRAENAAIKQQLSELNSLRREAAEVQMLRSQVAQMDPLRRKAAELDSLRGQLNELNMLKSKVAELSGLQGQLSEINNLKAQISQMNLSQQNAQDDEKEMLKRKLQELENLKMQYEQEIKTLKGAKSSVVKESSGLEKTQHLFEEKTQQISVKGDIIHNTEELELITRKINKSNKKITLNLLYKATVDSDKAKAFHDKCDQAQSSLVLIETDKGKRFGGFTTCSWAGECEEKKDEDAFVFSLDKMMTYDNIQGEDAIGCYPKFGPIFLGCQIRIYDNAFSKGGTTFEKGLNYNTEEDYELTGGERIFNVKEIEVYEVIAQ
jgi:chromosome segregation ATPase